MTVTVLDGHRTWGATRDDEGHREYTISHLVKTTDTLDGPSVIMTQSGLPQVGDAWTFDNDSDTWAFCTPWMKLKIHSEKEGDPNKVWRVDQKFSTLPVKRCGSTTIENPLLEPAKISGSFIKYTEEATQDKDGNAIKNSAHEMVRGSLVEFDANRPTVQIQQNVASLGLDVFSPMVDTVNDALLWGLSARKIKLSNVSWERNYYGSCFIYYSRTFDFDINFNTFDRVALDEGTKALGRLDTATGLWDSVGEFAPGVDLNPNNPMHFTRYKDKYGENSRVILNGAGVPIGGTDVGTGTGTGDGIVETPGTINIQKYTESNFLTLGIPTSL